MTDRLLFDIVRSIVGLAAILVFAGPVPLIAQAPASAALEPPRSELQAVPLPPLDQLEAAVADQIRNEQSSFLRIAQGKDPSGAELADAYGSLGRVFHAYEFFDAAEASYANAARLAPRDVRWPHLLGFLYQQTGRLEDAAERFVAARRIQPDDHAASVRLGEVYLALNRLKEAREQFQSVIAVFPALARNGLGEVALRERRFEDALAHFRAALDRVPQAVSIHYSIAMAYRGLGRMKEARSHLQQRGPGGIRIGDPIVDSLQALVSGERGLVVQGRRAYDSGQFKEAADAFSRALEVAPASVAARVNLGLALSQLGNAAGAAEQFEAALTLDAGNVIAHASLGMLLARQGRDAEAVGHLQPAFDQAPDDVNVRSELVAALLRLRREDAAIEALRKASSFEPDDEGALVSLAILLADRGRYSEAVALLAEANRRLPERAATATTLARLLASAPERSLRDGPRALELAMAVYESEPAPAHGETIALALAELGRCAEAVEWMRRALADAERAGDATEAARLEGEIPRYEGASCRR